ncbi:NAD(P)/FAD-dependent oxidoreductase [Motilimonas pumila]|uniref:NAD(P)/FAD-dependent oxidoreductase n=1 Tax=Motilimonas pumila TaxID=2303987 RepID=A0A418YHT7_9GAMM|nr:NAD(P)/FAD-dependent oxidoreductase [Motilimonas pumila]RJG49889.1 NAD(P)/FAD-dependent oxidoreductase [Motilimonas pumila]
MVQQDVIIIGAGAAGLMCAATAGYRGKSVLVLDHAKRAGRKILISGGGKCNFTNTKAEPHNFICDNPHFVKSALARYPSTDFIELVERHGIDFEERKHGQLFCLNDAKDIVNMLLTECEWAGAQVQLRTEILAIEDQGEQGFVVRTSQGEYLAKAVVVATGGLSMPKLGATPFGYQIAEQFGLALKPTVAGLVPFTWHAKEKAIFEPLSGISLPVTVSAEDGTEFSEDMLITHRGLSGPVMLQVSSYWQPGEAIYINLLPGQDAHDLLQQAKQHSPNQSLKNTLSQWFAKRFVEAWTKHLALEDKPLKQFDHGPLQFLADNLNRWPLIMNGTEGYRTAEVTLGGVDTDELSSKTMEAKKVPGLYFIGEVMDVTGWLGGYNFTWCWSSGVACGLAV